MGKSNNRKKKNTTTTNSSASAAQSNGGSINGNHVSTSSVIMKRAQELKEEGNRLFQAKDYKGALDQYDLAIKLTPPSHPDRAVFHSNRAACLLQMRPVDHRAVAHECTLALQSQPLYPRALLRRARALEALGNPQLALADVHTLLSSDPSNPDALHLAQRLQQSLPKPPEPVPSPAALGASAVLGLGPSLPSRAPPPLTKKPSPPPPTVRNDAPKKPLLALKPTKAAEPPLTSSSPSTISANTTTVATAAAAKTTKAITSESVDLVPKMRPLKLVYDHDIRLGSMPVNCRFMVLREIIGKRFPCSKSVLVKYRDSEGDLVTVTCTEELRMAEASADLVGEAVESNDGKKGEKLGLLRLYVVEVCPEQEPLLSEGEEELMVEEEREEEKPSEDENVVGETFLESAAEGIAKVEEVIKEKIENGNTRECNHQECKEAEIDDWLFEFAQLFRTHVGIDPEAHLDLHELGNELCSEALEETVTSEEAQTLFEMAASKFQEVAALAYFNWGNVHMCSARKKMAMDESAPEDVKAVQLQSAYDWIQERYALAGQKYEESLRIKPDFYEGLLALGQQHFETAKLRWSFAVAKKVDLATWDSIETLGLFDSAEVKMKAATEIWERLEEQRVNAVKDPASIKREELLKRRKKRDAGLDGQSSSSSPVEILPEEAAEHASAMRSQIHLFWGNMLFERSQVEFKLGLNGWKKNFDDAIERFKLAGASEADIAVVIKNHSSNEGSSVVDEKKMINLIDASENDAKDEDKHVIES